MNTLHGISLKKKFGQHFLEDSRYTIAMLDAVHLDENTSVLEIGCGAGFLTRAILETSIKALHVFEIDPEWATYVQSTFIDKRLHVTQDDILDIDWNGLSVHKPLVILANLPYQITFPFLYKCIAFKHFFTEAVIMIQEEVAQKIVLTGGRGYGFHALFLQHHATWKLLDKVPPHAFNPPPKVWSRLLYFKPKQNVPAIPNEVHFWKFIKRCFIQPRRTLRNNLQQTSYNISLLDETILQLRAQQMSFDDLYMIWEKIKNIPVE